MSFFDLLLGRGFEYLHLHYGPVAQRIRAIAF